MVIQRDIKIPYKNSEINSLFSEFTHNFEDKIILFQILQLKHKMSQMISI